jgi:hypothetical protein
MPHNGHRLHTIPTRAPDPRFHELRIIAEIGLELAVLATHERGVTVDVLSDHAAWLFEQVQRVAYRGEHGKPIAEQAD